MSSPPPTDFLVLDGVRLEYRRVPPPDAGAADAPTLVLLHEGLGCVGMWRHYPERLASALGLPALLYSRRGYGRSDPGPVPLPDDYHAREARDVLPRLLDAFGVARAILIGHSDGGMMALFHAALNDPKGRIRAVVAIGSHAFNEPKCVAGIVKARAAFEQGDLKRTLARWHGANTEAAFRGWCRAWLSPAFANWDMRPVLRHVTQPTLVVQGDRDEYGTLEQVEAFVAGVSGPAEAAVIPDCGHWPHLRHAGELTAAIQGFLKRHGPRG